MRSGHFLFAVKVVQTVCQVDEMRRIRGRTLHFDCIIFTAISKKLRIMSITEAQIAGKSAFLPRLAAIRA